MNLVALAQAVIAVPMAQKYLSGKGREISLLHGILSPLVEGEGKLKKETTVKKTATMNTSDCEAMDGKPYILL